MRRLVQVSTLVMALLSPVYGAYLAGTVILLFYRHANQQFVLHPGHVFLFIGCGSLAFGMVVNLVSYIGISAGSDSTTTFYASNLLVRLFETVGYLCAARFRFSSRWRCVFGVISALMAFDAAIAIVGIVASSGGWANPIYYVSSWFDEAVSISQTTLIVFLLVFARFQDVCRSTARDWMHWTGVLSIALDQVIGCVGDIGSTVIQLMRY